MKTKSLNAPKRISSRPSKSRNDCQLDPSEFRGGMGVRFNPIKCSKRNEKHKYRLQPEGASDNIVDITDLAKELATQIPNVRFNMIESILNALFDEIPKYIAHTGKSVRIGNLVTLTTCISGTLPHANDEADPEKNKLELHAIEVPALRHMFSRAKLVNALYKSPASVLVVVGGRDRQDNVVDESHETIVVARDGTSVYAPEQSYDDDCAAGRAWLETLDGKCVGRFDVLSATNVMLRLMLHLEARNVPSECRLVVETFGTKEASESGNALFLRYARTVRLAKDGLRIRA